MCLGYEESVVYIEKIIVDREWIEEERKGVWNYTDATNLKVSVRDAVSFFCVNIFIYFKRKLENQ